MSTMRCPACRASAGHLTLLTSMMTYFGCAQCSHRWQVLSSGEKSLPPEIVADAIEADVLVGASIDDGGALPFRRSRS
jgi:hypothetical protein